MKQPQRESALMFAAKAGKLNAVQHLINLGAMINGQNAVGLTIRTVHGLMQCWNAGRGIPTDLCLCEWSFGGGRYSASKWSQCKPERCGKKGVVWLLQFSTTFVLQVASTPLHFACGRRHMDIALFLLDRGADHRAATRQNKTPLDHCLPQHRVLLEVK